MFDAPRGRVNIFAEIDSYIYIFYIAFGNRNDSRPLSHASTRPAATPRANLSDVKLAINLAVLPILEL